MVVELSVNGFHNFQYYNNLITKLINQLQLIFQLVYVARNLNCPQEIFYPHMEVQVIQIIFKGMSRPSEVRGRASYGEFRRACRWWGCRLESFQWGERRKVERSSVVPQSLRTGASEGVFQIDSVEWRSRSCGCILRVLVGISPGDTRCDLDQKALANL